MWMQQKSSVEVSVPFTLTSGRWQIFRDGVLVFREDKKDLLCFRSKLWILFISSHLTSLKAVQYSIGKQTNSIYSVCVCVSVCARVCVYVVCAFRKKVLKRNEVVYQRAIKFIPGSSKIRKKLMICMLYAVICAIEIWKKTKWPVSRVGRPLHQ